VQRPLHVAKSEWQKCSFTTRKCTIERSNFCREWENTKRLDRKCDETCVEWKYDLYNTTATCTRLHAYYLDLSNNLLHKTVDCGVVDSCVNVFMHAYDNKTITVPDLPQTPSCKSTSPPSSSASSTFYVHPFYQLCLLVIFTFIFK
jgi:hypothetical protein